MSLFSFLSFYLFIVYTVFYLHVCLHARRGHYRWLWATMWLLGIELRTFGRAGNALNRWAISPAQFLVSFETRFLYVSLAHSVDQAGLQLRDLPASASPVLGLKVILFLWSPHVTLRQCQRVKKSKVNNSLPMKERQDANIKNDFSWLRALPALPKVLSSIPSNYIVAHNHL